METLLADATARLSAAGVTDAQRDARWLLRAAMGVSAAGLAAARGAPVPAAAAARFAAMLAAREARRPVSHILGERAFFGRRFRIDGRALDPRPESETLVETALAALPPEAPARVLDLGVGSGCLLLSVLAERPRARGLGVDQSPEALALAAENAALLDDEGAPAAPIGPRLELRRGDWLAGIAERFDLILCNPPYIPESDWAELAPEVRMFEPKAALTPGEDGLAVYRALAPLLAARLRPGGLAAFETGRGQAREVAALLAAAGLSARIHQDLGGVERVASARLDAGGPARE